MWYTAAPVIGKAWKFLFTKTFMKVGQENR